MIFDRLGPGEMLSVDLRKGQLRLNNDIKTLAASRKPYEDMLKRSVIELQPKSFRKDVETFIERYITDSELKQQALNIMSTDLEPVATQLDSKKLIATQSVSAYIPVLLF